MNSDQNSRGIPAKQLRRLRPAAAFLLAGAMVLMAAAIPANFRLSGLARMTFVFYTVDSGNAAAESRTVRRSGSVERDVARYVEEALLGPASPGFAPLLHRGTRLLSLMYRDGTVFADLSGYAALPQTEGPDAALGFETLRKGIFRNFPSVGEVRFFIDGRAAFAGDARR